MSRSSKARSAPTVPKDANAPAALPAPRARFALLLLAAAATAAVIAWLAWPERVENATAKADPESVRHADAIPPGEAPEGMVWIPGGKFYRGDNDPRFADAQPVRQISVDGFWMDQTEVTNRQFARFVAATGYKTVAELPPRPEDYPGVPLESLVAGSAVFTMATDTVSLEDHLAWWRYVPGADWQHPEGPDSDLKGRDDHPVVHVCWTDAIRYAEWAGKRLPTEAEWERAARGGLDRNQYTWGNQPPGSATATGKQSTPWQANIWQGEFPQENTTADGFIGTAPVASFPANGFGLSDMAGNVWEWCADWYHPDAYQSGGRINPRGPSSSFDPQEPQVPKRVQRGGSFLCSDLYCVRYRPGTRGKGAIDSGSSNVGFRCVMTPK